MTDRKEVFHKAKKYQAGLEAEVRKHGERLAKLSEGHARGPMNLTPDHIRTSPEYREAKQAHDAAFQKLRNFNGQFVKHFKNELQAERRERDAERMRKLHDKSNLVTTKEGRYEHHKLGPATALTEHQSDGKWHLHSLRVPAKHRKQGHAHKMMQELTKHADKHGHTMRLMSSPLDKKTHWGKLDAFYSKHGFERTGETNNGIPVFMERKPKTDTAAVDWKLPPAPGTAPIPKDHVRLYHQTHTEEDAEKIRHHGIKLSKARGIEGPKGIYADEQGFYRKPEDGATIEFHVHKDDWKKPFALGNENGDIPPENIIAVHHEWHKHARDLESDPKRMKEILAGKHDHLLEKGKPWRRDALVKALRYVKHKYKRNANGEFTSDKASNMTDNYKKALDAYTNCLKAAIKKYPERYKLYKENGGHLDANTVAQKMIDGIRNGERPDLKSPAFAAASKMLGLKTQGAWHAFLGHTPQQKEVNNAGGGDKMKADTLKIMTAIVKAPEGKSFSPVKGLDKQHVGTMEALFRKKWPNAQLQIGQENGKPGLIINRPGDMTLKAIGQLMEKIGKNQDQAAETKKWKVIDKRSNKKIHSGSHESCKHHVKMKKRLYETRAIGDGPHLEIKEDTASIKEEVTARWNERRERAKAGEAKAHDLVQRATAAHKGLRKLGELYTGDPAGAALHAAKQAHASYGLAHRQNVPSDYDHWMKTADTHHKDAEDRVAKQERRLQEAKERRKHDNADVATGSKPHINVKHPKNGVYETEAQAINHVLQHGGKWTYTASNMPDELKQRADVKKALQAKDHSAFKAHKRRGHWHVELA